MFRQVAPAPCSPPLGGSDAGSAVRFTPAVKYGGRENWPPGRAARCMSSHPCRAHHKLKWARKMQSGIKVLYKHLSRSESRKTISAARFRYHPKPCRPPNSARSTLSDRGWQQPLNHHEAQPACRVKDAEGTAKPLVLDSARWLGYLPASPVPMPPSQPIIAFTARLVYNCIKKFIRRNFILCLRERRFT